MKCPVCNAKAERVIQSCTYATGFIVQGVKTYRCTDQECSYAVGWLPGEEEDRMDRLHEEWLKRPPRQRKGE